MRFLERDGFGLGLYSGRFLSGGLRFVGDRLRIALHMAKPLFQFAREICLS
jgi:hypothetical protein